MSRPRPARPSPADFESLVEFERLVTDLSTRFVHLPPDEVDREIETSLRRVCAFLGVDLGVLWQWADPPPAVATATHLYYAKEGPRPVQPLTDDLFPWVSRQMLAGSTVVVPSVEELPEEAAVDRESARRLGIKSDLCIPLSVGSGPPVGALAFNTLHVERDWPDALVHRLELVAQVFGNALVRMRSERTLRRSQARLEAANDIAGLGYFEVDFGARTVYVDDRFRALCGIPPDREQELGILEFWSRHLHPDDAPRVQDHRRRALDGELEQFHLEYRYLHPVHGEIWLDHVGRAAERDANGRAIRTYGVLRDVTERRRAEEGLRQSLAEIAQLKDRLQAESDYLKAEIREVQAHGEITGRSAAIQGVLRQVEQVAQTDSSVLIRGETGTGKELVARAIHRASPRSGHLMVKVNCAALPSGLVESELFGREKGAYTGALTRQIGRFEVADRSTIFLDEIGELSLDVQAKLLHVLETGEFERLGSPRTIRVDVRVIAATHRDLAEDVRAGRFREDLFYRLNVFPIRVPPLRERTEDIPQLVWTFLEEFSSRMGKKITQVSRQTMEALQGQRWPGNVRELRNVIERAAILTTNGTLVMPALDESVATAPRGRTLAESERELILQALERAGGHVKGPRGAAAQLGLKPATLYGRMNKLGIRPHSPPENGPG